MHWVRVLIAIEDRNDRGSLLSGLAMEVDAIWQ